MDGRGSSRYEAIRSRIRGNFLSNKVLWALKSLCFLLLLFARVGSSAIDLSLVSTHTHDSRDSSTVFSFFSDLFLYLFTYR